MIDKFYKDFEQEITKSIKSNEEMIAFYRVMFIKNINKTGLERENALLADAIVSELEKENKEFKDDLKRIAGRNQAAPTMVKWHRTAI